MSLANKYAVPLLKRMIIGIVVLLSTCLLCCSPNENVENTIPEPPPELPTLPYSVKIQDGNYNFPSSGVLSSQYSDSPYGSDIGKAADSDPKTKFVTGYDNFHILWSGDTDVAINYLSITSAGDNPKADPKSWTFFGSRDNVHWVALDSQTDQQFVSRYETKEYHFQNDADYKYYKLEITGNNGGEETQIAELALVVPRDPDAPHSSKIEDANRNMLNGGILTAQYSDFPPDSHIGMIADNDLYTNYVTSHDEFYIIWEGNKTAIVNYYSLTSGIDAPASDPKSWCFYGSNDLEKWDLLDTQADQVFDQRRQKKEYRFGNTTVYLYYKLAVDGNNGGTTTQIAEWTMRGFETDIDDLLLLASGGTNYSRQTPMGIPFENKPIATPEDIEWLENPLEEPRLVSGCYWKEFPVDLYPYGRPIPGDVNQNSIGNCCMVALIASLSYSYPDFIRDIIHTDDNKNFTVDMFCPLGKPIKVAVSNKFWTYGDYLYGISGQNGMPTWASVLEKAMNKYNNVYRIMADGFGGVGTNAVIQMVTGDGSGIGFDTHDKVTAEDKARIVRVSLTQGKIVVGGFSVGDLPLLDVGTTITGHCWSMMHSANPEALFSMRNPWGRGSNDWVSGIPNNSTVPRTIDIRINNPGKAANYGRGAFEPYIPSVYFNR